MPTVKAYKTKKWQCEECHQVFSTKRQLVEDLIGHLEEASEMEATANDQLDSLGITEEERFL